ncbi:MAG TPA: metallophosphoesterase [Bacteroidota bacterium]|nr:metallophosphoesterase [Bacteroidota bacterium]
MKTIVLTFLVLLVVPVLADAQVQFTCSELLGRPTNTSITIHACANKTLDVYFEYGTDSLAYRNQTSVRTCADSIPFVFVLDQLSPNTRYFYRMRYREVGTSVFLARAAHSFRTQRPPGAAFTFAIQADPHMDENSNPAVYAQTLQNIALQNPDFLIDLGDTFMSEKLQHATQDSITLRHLLLRSYYDLICHSIPLFLVIGNHEGELGWLLDGTANSLPVMAATTRLKYFPNPLPDGFYSGNKVSEPFVGLRQNYYAWEWGSALFVVIDPYWYTKSKPNWGWTLGVDQYNWLRNVLTTSRARFKFVFCHQLVGGNGNDGRGGVEFAHLFEQGGRNADSTWGFDTYRPGWQKPVHTLMVENNGAIYFHGHDHFYGKQVKDGVIYQEVPQPSAKSYTTISATDYGYASGVLIPSRGYLLVTVSDTSTQVKYVRTYVSGEENAQRHNGDISDSYTIQKTAGTTSVVESGVGLSAFALDQNYPNPFNPSTAITFQLPAVSFVTIDVYDVLGRKNATLVNGICEPGAHTVRWDGAGSPSGLYFYKMTAESQSSPSLKSASVKKMLLLR